MNSFHVNRLNNTDQPLADKQDIVPLPIIRTTCMSKEGNGALQWAFKLHSVPPAAENWQLKGLTLKIKKPTFWNVSCLHH